MAFLVRSARVLGLRSFSSSHFRLAAAKCDDGITGKIADYEQTTGLERAEMDQIAKGNADPFGLTGAKVAAFGTRANPRPIPSYEKSRIVGCACEEDSEMIRFFEVHAGDSTMCPCSRRQYFKLVAGNTEGLSDGIPSGGH